MAKLKNTPVGLHVVNVLSVIAAIVCCVGLFFTVVAFLKREEYGFLALYCAIGGGVNWGLFAGLYHIAKAACLFVEKEENAQ